MTSIALFDQQYPNLIAWILGGDAWIELGENDFSYSRIRILDIGGMIWESDERYKTVAEALAAAELALAHGLGRTYLAAILTRELARHCGTCNGMPPLRFVPALSLDV